MDTLYIQTNKLIEETQLSYQALERASPQEAIEVEDEINRRLNLINSNCEKMEVFVFKLPLEHRQNAKLRCDQLKYDCKHLQAALISLKQKRARKEAEKMEREQLLHRKFAPNPDLTTINIDYGLQHQNSLINANRGVDEMLQTGANTLESLRSQRFTLKGAQRRILDMANVLGLSNHTMRLIEKRASEDKVILILGVVITLAVILLVIVYFA